MAILVMIVAILPGVFIKYLPSALLAIFFYEIEVNRTDKCEL